MQLQMFAEPRTIPAIKRDGELIADQEQKEEHPFSKPTNELLGNIQNREHTLDLEELGLMRHDFQELGEIFLED
jgi:hypothetical protein